MNTTFEDQEEVQLRVCRVCLSTDVKMHSLQTAPLDAYFEAIIGIPVMSTMELPMFLCFECTGYVCKFSRFKERCLQAQANLYRMFMLQHDVKITKDLIKQMNRKQQGSTLAATQTITMEYNPLDEDSLKIEVENHRIKEEPPLTHGTEFEHHDVMDYQDGTSSDDEPLSVHKSSKEAKQLLTEFVMSVENYNEDLIDSKPVISPEVTRKRKRGRPKKGEIVKKIKKSHKIGEQPSKPVAKSRRTANTGGVHNDDIDLDQYVNVINLTLEEQLQEIEERKTRDNYLNAPLKCDICYRGFIDANAFNHHVKKHDPSAGDIECPVCKFRFPSKRGLQKHTINHAKKYSCRACNFVSKTATQAKQHQRWHKGVTYKCEYCDEVATKWTSYLSHVRIKHPSQFICGVCGYSFVSQLGLNMHKTMMHKDVNESKNESEAESGPYCEECDVKFVSLEAYNRHMVTSIKHAQENDFTRGCRVCGATFSTPEEMRLHHRKLHARMRPKNYGKKAQDNKWPRQCQHCMEEIASARDYWSHFRRAHPDEQYPIKKDYVCDVCGKAFRGNAFLKYHKRTHSSERLYACPTCGKSFYNRTNLTMHCRTHSEDRPHACPLCGKGFKNKGALDRHYRSHTGEKPYVCEVCGKGFNQSNSRKLHVRTVHLKQPAPYVSRARQERKKTKDTLDDKHAYIPQKHTIYNLPLTQVAHVITP